MPAQFQAMTKLVKRGLWANSGRSAMSRAGTARMARASAAITERTRAGAVKSPALFGNPAASRTAARMAIVAGSISVKARKERQNPSRVRSSSGRASAPRVIRCQEPRSDRATSSAASLITASTTYDLRLSSNEEIMAREFRASSPVLCGEIAGE